VPSSIVKEINLLKKDILQLGTIVEDNLQKAMVALLNRDEELARNVQERDNEIDRTEINVEEHCLNLLALYQPVAGDLRFVITVLKINNDLERIGDLAAKIADKVLLLADLGGIMEIPQEFEVMFERTMWMLKTSLDALIREDSDLAYKVRLTDHEVNEAKRLIRTKLEELIGKDSEQAIKLVKLMGVSRSLERIADHATNIAEDVLYLLQGRIVRHR
jgi:phosphate transport system protein